jgi:hypothetical protein
VLWVRCGNSRRAPVIGRRHLGDGGIAELRNFENQTSKVKSQNFLCNQLDDCSDGRRPKTEGRRLSANGFSAVEQALKVTDFILQGGGFGFVAIDMGDVPSRIARRVPLTSWFRFRRAVEKTRTVLLVIEQEAHASTCAALVVSLRLDRALRNEEAIAHAQLLHGVEICAEVTRIPGKKQPQSAGARFRAESQWRIG